MLRRVTGTVAGYGAGIPGADDQVLVHRAREGDRQALEQLLRRHHQRVWAICRRIAGNDADAADATQEALIAVVRNLHRFDGRSRFTTWLYRVATNACLDEIRRRSRRPVAVPTVDERTVTAPDHATDVVDRRIVDEALTALSPEFRAAVTLRDLCDLDYATIAEILDIPPGTVRSRIARARAELADRLTGNREGAAQRRRVQDD